MNTRMIAPLLAAVLPFTVGAQSGDPQDAAGVVIDGHDLTLRDLLDVAERQLDIDAFLLPEPRHLEESLAFKGVIDVAGEDFLPFFEQVLRSHDFLHLEFPTGSSTVHQISKITAQGGRGTSVFKTRARVVTPAQARAMGNRNTLITTAYACKHLPSRDAVNTLQPYFADSFTDNLRNIEGTPYILMTGFSSTLAGVLGLLEEIDVLPPEGAMVPYHPNRIKKLEQQVQNLLERVEELEAER